MRLRHLTQLALFATTVSAIVSTPAAAQGCTLVDCPNQAPSVSVIAVPVAPGDSTISLTIEVSDAEGVTLASKLLSVGGVDSTSWYSNATFTSSGGSSPLATSWTGTMRLSPGTRTITATICDGASACTQRSVDVTVAEAPTSPPARTTPTMVLAQRTDMRSLGAGGSALSYGTPTYTSVNTPRGLTLLYSSEVATSATTVEADVTIHSTETPAYLTLEVIRGGVSKHVAYYKGATGVRRLAARFTDSCPGGAVACAQLYDLKVTAHYPGDPRHQTYTNIRLFTLDQSNSPYGRGWVLPGAARLFAQSDGVVLWDGAFQLAFFALTSACTGSGASESCDYTSPQGNFTTLRRRPAHVSYGTRYLLGGRGGDTTYFTDAGLAHLTKARFEKLQTYYSWETDGLGTRLKAVTDPRTRAITLYYASSSGGSGFKPGSLRFIHLPDGREITVQVDSVTSNLTRIDGPDAVTDLQVSYASGTSRATSWTQRLGGGSFGYDGNHLLSYTKGVSVPFEGGTGADSTRLATTLSQALAAARTSTTDTVQQPLPPLAAQVADSVLSTTGASSKVWRNAFGLPVRSVSRGPAGDSTVTVTSYNSSLLPTHTAVLGKSSSSFEYSGSPVPLLSSVTNGVGETTTYTYGPFDQVKTVHVNGVKQSEAFFTGANALAPDSVRSDTGNVVRYRYDNYGRLRSTRDARWVLDTMVVDAIHGNTNGATQSASGYPTRTIAIAFDAAGRDTMVTDHLNRVSKTGYDALNRVIRQARLIGSTASPDTILYSFQDQARKVSMRDAMGNQYVDSLNAAGLVVASTSPDSLVTTFGYTRQGALVRTTDRRGVVATDSLDLRGRVVRRIWSLGGAADTVTFAYEATGRWAAARSSASTDTIFADGNGRQTLAVTVRDGTRYELQNGWVGSMLDGVTVSSFTGGSGTAAWTRSTGSGYDGLQREKVIQDFSGAATTLSFDSREMEKTVNFPNYTVTKSNTIGTLGELTQVTYSGLAGGLDRSYEFDASTRISRVLHGVSTDYTARIIDYDNRDRLAQYRDVRTWQETIWEPWDPYGDCPGCMIQTDVTHEDELRSATYTYDKNGNPAAAGDTVKTGNRLVARSGKRFTYDAAGHLRVARTVGTNDSTRYVWSLRGLLDSVIVKVGGATTVVTYGYDAWGQRVRRTGAAGTTRYLLHDGHVLMEVSGSNAIEAEYSYYPGVDRPHAMRRNGTTYYYAQDAQGNVQGLMTAGGTVVATYEYTPHGAPVAETGSVVNTLRWKGREWDAEAGLYYVRARYYDPGVGRFVSEDPIGTAGGINLYAYGDGDQLNRSDPSGLCDNPPCPTPMQNLPTRRVIVVPWFEMDLDWPDHTFGWRTSRLNELAERRGQVPWERTAPFTPPPQSNQALGCPATGLTAPLKNSTIRNVDSWGLRLHPIHKDWRHHAGTDASARMGTPIFGPVGGGRVVGAAAEKGYGLTVVVRSHGVLYRYSHMQSASVSPGSMLGPSAVLGRVGVSGGATGPHVHWEIQTDAGKIDPQGCVIWAP